MPTIRIIFNNSDKVYFEGEKLSAKLQIHADNPVNISSVSTELVGECWCSCNTQNDDQRSSVVKQENEEREIYFDDVLKLFEAENEEASFFDLGIHQFVMEYDLPCCLPTSLESPHGHVRYWLEVTVHFKEKVIKHVQYFTVVSKVDLKIYPMTNVPVVLWKHGSYCVLSSLCMRGAPVRAFVHITKKGFVPGECLTINAEVNNFSRLPVNWVKACVVQVLKYNYVKVTKRKRVIVEVTRGSIMPFDSQTWMSENLLIPAIPPSTSTAKCMINVKYKFYFLIKTSWQEKAISIKQNLLIGTVPLLEQKQTQERGQGECEIDVNNQLHNYTNTEPCIFGPYFTGKTNSTLSSYSPMYPIYN